MFTHEILREWDFGLKTVKVFVYLKEIRPWNEIENEKPQNTNIGKGGILVESLRFSFLYLSSKSLI